MYVYMLEPVKLLCHVRPLVTPDYSPPGSSVHGDSLGKNTKVGCHALLQGIFPTQGSNPGLPHCRQMLYHLSHQGSPPENLKEECLSFLGLQAIFPVAF